MPCPPEELEEFCRFTQRVWAEAGLANFDWNKPIWHYTNGAGLRGIIESGAVRATHVAAVNDSTETVYATRLYREAITRMQVGHADDQSAYGFLQGVLDETVEAPDMPGHADSKFFVACFTELEDNIQQCLSYGGEHGENSYTIGFKSKGLLIDRDTVVVRVNYDTAFHQRILEETARLPLEYGRRV